MEGQNDFENLLWLMSSNFGVNANNDVHGPGDEPNQHFAMTTGKSANQPNPLPLPQWSHCQKAPRSYVDFLAESSTFLEHATGADMLETITSPIGGTRSVCGGSEIQTELLFNNLGSPCGYIPGDPSLDMDASKVRIQNPYNEVESANNYMTFQPQILPQQYHTSGRQELHEDNLNVSQLYPRVKVSPSFFQSKPHSGGSRQRSGASDRYRRLRIAERVRALRELLPHSVEGNQAAVMDDIIDYIKFLQLQVKELSRSRLGGQPACVPFVFLEGYGHYVLSGQTTNEPLEEMLGKLIKMNPSAASELLERRGLYIMPMSLTEG